MMTYAALSPANLKKCTDKHGNKYTYYSYSTKTRKVKYACPVHGDKEQFLVAHLRGMGCPDCAVDSRRMTLEEFETKARKVHGDKYTYISVFEQGRTQAVIKCPEHGEFEQSANSHLAGNGCAKCGNTNKVLSRTYTFAEATAKAAEIHLNKYKYTALISEGGKPKLAAICSEHGEFNIGVYSHMQGAGCKKCGAASRSRLKSYSFEEMALKSAKVHNDKYSYVSATGDKPPRLNIVCPKHGEFQQGANDHMMGHGCRKCSGEFISASKRHNFEELTARVEKIHNKFYSYKALSYESGRPVLTIICPKHGEFEQLAGDHLDGHGCSMCSPRITGPNVEIKEYLESLGLLVEMEASFSSNKRQKLDILIPNLKLAVEYHGQYWHSSRCRADNYHIEKHNAASVNGIRTIHVFSSEWTHKKEIVKSILSTACNTSKAKTYARKLALCEVDSKEAGEFYDTYHIQGKPQGGQFVGLREAENLVAVMAFSFNTSDRKAKAVEHTVELTRYATSTNVVGGFTRLLKYWLKQNLNVEQVTSYSDVRLYSGKTYELAGFEKMHTTAPDYKYLEAGDVLRHKSNYQKSKLVQRFGAEACEGKTERQITEEQGLYRVYDCGLTKWVLRVKK